ncbi:hypothetical protein [Bartonella doshiae]|uniref:hypothetical protein n=1 Tax=Bartonella doshiae TaxID=33044 RepID=UPI0009452601|nr:hypothetical protein [Bartonella doshiae]
MNMKHFIIAFVTVFAVQGTSVMSVMASQKLVFGMASAISSRDFLSNRQMSYSLEDVFREKFSSVDYAKGAVTVQLIVVSSSTKNKSSKSGKNHHND